MGSLTKVDEVLHMVGGIEKTSYANNSRLQKAILIKARPSIEESLRGLYSTMQPKRLMIADLGCSSGPNTLMVLSDIIATTDSAYRHMNHPIPEVKVFLNDLPGNDFNTLFRSVPSFYRRLEDEQGRNFGTCFISATPGSFYGRLFPRDFVHFIHSCYGIHWLSQVPKGLVGESAAVNSGNICVDRRGPPEVTKAYQDEFAADFELFLRLRSKEIVPGGRMVITIRGSTEDDDGMWAFKSLGMTLKDIVSEGLIAKEKFSGFNLPLYAPTAEDVKKLVENEGSFALNKLESFTVKWDVQAENPMLDLHSKAKFMAGTYRAASESLLSSEFGEAIMDELFERFTDKIVKQMAIEECKYFNLVISLIKT
ncbi:hypothetical protein Ancab_040607 [Ancistrocladus abbreviatus]